MSKELVSRLELQARWLEQGKAWLHEVGTFGIRSASSWRGRLTASLLRALCSLTGNPSLFGLLLADELLLMAWVDDLHHVLTMALLFLQVAGVPTSWRKLGGRVSFEWVGFWLDLGRFAIGLSTERAGWVRHRLSGEVGRGLVRLSFAAQALAQARPFLDPVYALVCSVPLEGLHSHASNDSSYRAVSFPL